MFPSNTYGSFGSLESAAKEPLDGFNRFCTVHGFPHHTNTHTPHVRATSVATGRIYTPRARDTAQQ